MSTIAQAVREFLEERKWTWQEVDDHNYRFIVPSEIGRWVCVLRWENDSYIGCYSSCTLNVPHRRRAAAAEYLMRATFGLRLGNFEMDFEDGEVVFKTGAPLEGIEPSMEFVRALAFANYSTMDRYLPGLMSVAFGKTAPKAAVEEAEKPKSKRKTQEDDEENEDEEAGADRSRPRPGGRTRSAGDNNVAQLTPREQKELRNRVPIPVGRGGRVAQITNFLRLMVKRTHEEAKDTCFANISLAKGASLQDKEVDRFVQFCFQEDWFAVDLPNTGILPAEAERVLRERRGFYREAERPDAGVTTDVSELVEFDPIGKKYIYGDEREAAEDAAYLLFDV